MRILVVDPDEIWRLGFRQVVIDAGWEICAETSDWLDAERLILEREPDVIAADLSYPIENLESLVRQHPRVGIVLLTSQAGSHGEFRRLLKAGAGVFISKYDSAGDVHQAIEAALRCDTFISQTASGLVLDQSGGGEAPAPSRREPSQALTRRERQVTRLLADGKTNREVAEALRISVKTVENHRANAMRKLGARAVRDLVRTAIESGIIEP